MTQIDEVTKQYLIHCILLIQEIPVEFEYNIFKKLYNNNTI